jgi:ABC-type multidrug transport system fused ATPase/permease subunit
MYFARSYWTWVLLISLIVIVEVCSTKKQRNVDAQVIDERLFPGHWCRRKVLDPGTSSPMLLLTVMLADGILGACCASQIWGEAYDRPESSVYASFASSTTTISGQTTLQDFGLGATTALTASYSGFSGSSSPSTSLPNANAHPLFYVGVYAAIEGAYVLIKVLMEVVQYVGAYRASQDLFKRLLSSVVRATMRWHDTTPSGAELHSYLWLGSNGLVV